VRRWPHPPRGSDGARMSRGGGEVLGAEILFREGPLVEVRAGAQLDGNGSLWARVRTSAPDRNGDEQRKPSTHRASVPTAADRDRALP
jgi:hypothetical protein